MRYELVRGVPVAVPVPGTGRSIAPKIIVHVPATVHTCTVHVHVPAVPAVPVADQRADQLLTSCSLLGNLHTINLMLIGGTGV